MLLLVVLGVVHAGGAVLPTVTAHGMGDSCFNAGFKAVTSLVGNATGGYSVCVPTGDTKFSDTNRGFLYSMVKSVDTFAAKVQADPALAGGFNAVGFSQGNSIIRGYIHKYNNPPVKTWLSVHGTVMGVAGFPPCDLPVPQKKRLCRFVDEYLYGLSFSTLSQGKLLQAGYFKDPMRVNDTAYKTNSELAQWNGEGLTDIIDTYKSNFVSVDRMVMIRAMKDTQFSPSQSEHWGFFAPGDSQTMQNMEDTDVYKHDTFGLQTMDKAGKILFNTTDGDHLQFADEQLQWWVQNYFLA